MTSEASRSPPRLRITNWAVRSGVRYAVQTGGSSRDEGVIHAADEYGMVFINLRLFHH